jgi:hypothetical protein
VTDRPLRLRAVIRRSTSVPFVPGGPIRQIRYANLAISAETITHLRSGRGSENCYQLATLSPPSSPRRLAPFLLNNDYPKPMCT